MNCSDNIQEYFDTLKQDALEAYKLAEQAREQGYDPSDDVEIKLAETLSDRVIGLITVVAPQLEDSNAPERIQELEDKYGVLDWRVAFKIAEAIANEEFCEFEDEREAIEVGIRTGFAYVTLGVVSAPIEGFTELEIKQTRDGKDYFCLNYSGPVRNAGGTAASVSVLISDYLRKQFGYAEYDPTDAEIERCHSELRDYHERVANLQYYPSEEESKFLVEQMPVEIGGEPSERYEVSNVNVKDLDRIPTDVIRSGYCLIHSSCVPLKAPKMWKRLEQWGEEFDMEQWNFLEDFLKLQKESKSQGETSEGISPDYTYIKDLVSGRPVLGHPLREGGLRLRYGRSRVTGLSSMGMHPATMIITEDFIGTGTQVKTERPGKAASMIAVDSIDGPVVKLEDGSVHQLDEEQAREVVDDIDEILYMGDVLVNYGDFVERAHPLVPPGYCEEYWKRELEAVEGPDVNPRDVDFDTATELSEEFDVPLHPAYTYFWTAIEPTQIRELKEWVEQGREEDNKLILPLNDRKRLLELIAVPHRVVNNEYVVIQDDHARALQYQVREEYVECEDALDTVNEMAPVTIRDKAGTFIGGRMGRPEKAKLRKLKGNPHCLFPVGEEGGRRRSIQAALEEGKIRAEFKTYENSRGEEVPFPIDPVTGERNEEVEGSQEFTIDINDHLDNTLDKLDMRVYPDLIKGVRGTMSEEHYTEDLAKGVLRAHHQVHVNKDGTVRYDSSELPITHFKPEEISVSVDELHELGYETDHNGEPLERSDQIVELKPQDVVLPCCPESPEPRCDEILHRTANFVDDLLTEFYGLNPYYECEDKHDLVGEYIIGLAPHTSAGTLGRIIGFSETQGFFAHPLFHSAMRRDCDGDESCFVLLMDAYLNFSAKFLPDSRGGTMDAPLVLTLLLNPAEVDDMVFNMDVTYEYDLDFYKAAEEYTDPTDVDMHILESDLGTERQFEGMGFTHDVSDFNKGVRCSSYKTLPSMEEKLKGQMGLAERIRAVDMSDVARLVIEKHFIKDTKGNLKKFSQQEFRCVTCNDKYRRPPLRGQCTSCGGRLIFTVSQGNITKYLEPSLNLGEEFDVPPYLQQTLELLKRRVEEVFGTEDERQEELEQWF